MAGLTSAPAASRTVLLFSIDSRTDSSSRFFSRMSAISQRIFSFLDGSMPRQAFFSKLARAALTARSTSQASASGTVVRFFPPAIDEQFARLQLRFDDFTYAHGCDSKPVP